MNAYVLPELSCMDLVAILIKCIQDGAEKRLVICSAYLPYYSEDSPPSRDMRNLCDTLRMTIYA